jgi:hypothetical protein
MRTMPRDTPGDQVSGGIVFWSDYGTGWVLRPAQDYNGIPLGNGKFEVRIAPGMTPTIVRFPWTQPWDPSFFRNQ